MERPHRGAGISVVVPTHNRRDLLARALDSVYAQTVAADEVIVVDDGSTDGSGAMVTARYPDAICVSQPHAGVSAARNRGISSSRGAWIAFLDSDDEWLPEKLARQIDCLSRRPEAKLCHTDEIWIRNGTRINPQRQHAKPDGWAFAAALPLCCISPSSALVDRTIFDEIGVFDEGLPACEDYDLWLRVTARYPVALVAEPLVVKHGGHADQLSRRYWGMDRFRIRALEQILASGVLDPEQRRSARHALRQKVEVYLQGARKRHKTEDVLAYAAKLRALDAPAAGSG